jgi:elongation factor Tu
VRELLSFYEFPGDDTPIIRGSALAAINVSHISRSAVVPVSEALY